MSLAEMIGVSLSESHTGMTSLRLCMCKLACLLGPTTYCKAFRLLFWTFCIVR